MFDRLASSFLALFGLALSLLIAGGTAWSQQPSAVETSQESSPGHSVILGGFEFISQQDPDQRPLQWRREANNCYRTDSSAYNERLERLAELAFGGVSDAYGCVTLPYLASDYDPDCAHKICSEVHAGIDLRSRPNPDLPTVYAIEAGSVLSPVSFDPSNGRSTLIMLTEDGRHKILYLHLSEIYVEEGQPVDRGDPIGRAGSVGASAAHLHLEVWPSTSPLFSVRERAISGSACRARVCTAAEVSQFTQDPALIIDDPEETVPTRPMPPQYIIDHGICSSGPCEFGERWRVMRDTVVYQEPPNRPGIDESGLSGRRTLREGEWVTTVTGLVIAPQRPARILIWTPERTRRHEIGYAYTHLGEGFYRVWSSGNWLPELVEAGYEADGAYHVRDGLRGGPGHQVYFLDGLDGPTPQDWWVQLEREDGSLVWAGNPDRSSTAGALEVRSQAGLNSALAEAILSREDTLAEKLTVIDELLALGAQINGRGTRHGRDPQSAALRIRDVELLQAMLERGLDLNHGCPANSGAGAFLRRGGDTMLATLLDHGMELGCMTTPPLHSYLGMGTGTESYNEERAERVAAVLLEHGADPCQESALGENIYEFLERRGRPRLARRISHQVEIRILQCYRQRESEGNGQADCSARRCRR